MELIERYIYAVTKSLPVRQRADIEKELRSIIEDMIEQDSGHEPRLAKVKKALLELGDPSLLANNYRAAKRYLIGPQLFDNYLLVLKIVAGAVFLGITIATVLGMVFSSEINGARIVVNYFGTLAAAMFQAFTWVTIGFGLAEHYGQETIEAKHRNRKWDVADLPEPPEKSSAIPIWEPITAIIFSIFFLILFLSTPHLLGIYFPTEPGWVIIPFFSVTVLKTYRLLVLGIFLTGLAKEIMKLVSGRWTLKLSIFVTGLTIVSIILTILLFTNPGIWNENFVSELREYTDTDFDLAGLWNAVTENAVYVIIIGSVIEIISAVIKGIKPHLGIPGNKMS